jgi:hypothetical protein
MFQLCPGNTAEHQKKIDRRKLSQKLFTQQLTKLDLEKAPLVSSNVNILWNGEQKSDLRSLLPLGEIKRIKHSAVIK